MFLVVFLVTDRHQQLPLGSLHHHRLPVHLSDHVERRLRLAPERDLQQVVLDALLHDLAQFVADLEEAVRRAQPADALVRTPVVVVLHPQRDPFLSLFEAVEPRAAQELGIDVLPEALDLAERLGMVRRRTEVVDLVLAQFILEAGLAAPVGVLPPVVGQHLTRHAVLTDPAPVRLQDVFRRLAAEHPQRDHKARVVVHEPE